MLIAKKIQNLIRKKFLPTTNNNKAMVSDGFTLIEISLATVYIGIIIMMLSGTAVNIVNQYNRGVWLSQISQAGQQLSEDIGEKARYSNNVTIRTDAQRVCVGGITYMWRTEYDIEHNMHTKNNVRDPGMGDLRGGSSLIRVKDYDGFYCTNNGVRVRPSSNRTTSKNAGDRVSGDFSRLNTESEHYAEILLSRNATIQYFNVSESGRLLTLNAVISTKNDNAPHQVNGQWVCGNWVNGQFKEGKNEFCAFAEYNITVYERGTKKNE